MPVTTALVMIYQNPGPCWCGPASHVSWDAWRLAAELAGSDFLALRIDEDGFIVCATVRPPVHAGGLVTELPGQWAALAMRSVAPRGPS